MSGKATFLTHAKQQHRANSTGLFRSAVFGLIAGLCGSGASYILFLLYSRAGVQLPEYLPQSLLGVEYVYTAVFFLALMLKLLAKPKLISYYELGDRAARQLFSPLDGSTIALSKTVTGIVPLEFSYLVGAGVMVLYASFMELPLLPNYVLTLLTAGALAIALTVSVALMLSAVVMEALWEPVYMLAGMAVAQAALYVFGYYSFMDGAALIKALASVGRLDGISLLTVTALLLCLNTVASMVILEQRQRANRFVLQNDLSKAAISSEQADSQQSAPAEPPDLQAELASPRDGPQPADEGGGEPAGEAEAEPAVEPEPAPQLEEQQPETYPEPELDFQPQPDLYSFQPELDIFQPEPEEPSYLQPPPWEQLAQEYPPPGGDYRNLNTTRAGPLPADTIKPYTHSRSDKPPDERAAAPPGEEKERVMKDQDYLVNQNYVPEQPVARDEAANSRTAGQTGAGAPLSAPAAQGAPRQESAASMQSAVAAARRRIMQYQNESAGRQAPASGSAAPAAARPASGAPARRPAAAAQRPAAARPAPSAQRPAQKSSVDTSQIDFFRTPASDGTTRSSTNASVPVGPKAAAGESYTPQATARPVPVSGQPGQPARGAAQPVQARPQYDKGAPNETRGVAPERVAPAPTNRLRAAAGAPVQGAPVAGRAAQQTFQGQQAAMRPAQPAPQMRPAGDGQQLRRPMPQQQAAMRPVHPAPRTADSPSPEQNFLRQQMTEGFDLSALQTPPLAAQEPQPVFRQPLEVEEVREVRQQPQPVEPVPVEQLEPEELQPEAEVVQQPQPEPEPQPEQPPVQPGPQPAPAAARQGSKRRKGISPWVFLLPLMAVSLLLAGMFGTVTASAFIAFEPIGFINTLFSLIFSSAQVDYLWVMAGNSYGMLYLAIMTLVLLLIFVVLLLLGLHLTRRNRPQEFIEEE